MTAYIFGAGEYTGGAPKLNDGDFVICADAGYLTAQRLGLRVDLAIGDFDSLGYEPELCEEVVTLPVEKDITDAEAAILAAEEMGAETIVLLGCTGGRPDHTLAAQQLLAAAAERGKRPYLVGDGFVAYALHGGAVRFSEKAVGTLSVFAVGGVASGVTVKGAKYELEGAELSPSAPLGVSNSFVGRGGFISLQGGTLLLF
ncbi:MAG: thiamine diphosphokinase, partial [Clostridia bacterium]|nr:thiamine diphosphokinase [Clostridia bacterium]